jgi:hypothetical protein
MEDARAAGLQRIGKAEPRMHGLIQAISVVGVKVEVIRNAADLFMEAGQRPPARRCNQRPEIESGIRS